MHSQAHESARPPIPPPGRTGDGRQPARPVDGGRDPSDAIEASFRHLAESLSDLVWSARPDGYSDYYNRRFLTYLGLEPGEMGGWTWAETLHPDDVEGARRAWERAFTTGGDYEVEFRLRRHDGEFRWHRSRGSPLRDEAGRIARWFGTCTDIDDRKKAEGERERLFDVGADMLVVVGLDGYFKRVSPASERTLGWTPEEMTSRPWADFLHPDDRATARDLARHVAEGREVLSCENRYRHRDGSYRWLDWRARSFPGEGLIYAGATDITGRKRAEELQGGQRGVLEMIASGAPLADVLAAACRLIEAQEPGLLCSVLLADGDGRHTGEAFGPSLAPEFIRALAGHGIGSPYVGSCCEALDRGREVVVPDIAADRRWSAGWRDLNLSHGLRACRSIPISGPDGTVLASVAVFGREPGDPGPSDGHLLDVATHLAGIAIDRERAEARERRLLTEAATANAQFRAFFEQGALFAGIMAVDGTILEPNRLALEACGYTREQVVGRPFWECPWWSRSPELVRQIRAASARAAAGEAYRAELPYYVADGSERVVDFILLPIKDESGRVMFLAPTGMDITDRKRAEEALREGRERLRIALAASDTGTFRWEPETGTFLEFDDNLKRLFGFEPDHPVRVTEDFLERVHPDDLASLARAVDRCRRGEDFEMEYRVVLPDGGIRWLYDRGKMVPDDEGRPAYLVGACTDITKRKRVEEALQDADRRKDEFLATLAHELRNPLAPIRNALHLMKGPGGDGRDREAERAMAERQVVHLARLVDDLMDVARISRGKIELRKQAVDLHTVVRQAVETARPLIDDRRHRLTVALPEGPIGLEADPTRLEQVLWNLLNNAAKYTEPGGRIDLSAARQGGEVVVRVRDTGIGIEPAMLPRLFQMFVQVGEHREHAQGGLGIGLGLVKSLVEMHGGTIAARSGGPGRGSEFAVRLPALPAAAPGPAGPARAGRAGVEPSLPRRRILVVDDNVDAARSLAKVLSRLYGQEVAVAHDGPGALEVVPEFRPEVVLLDIGLPGMDGHEVARRLRERPESGRALIVALTGWGQESDRRKSAQAGFDRHLVKPVDPDALRALLAEAVGGGAGPGAGLTGPPT